MFTSSRDKWDILWWILKFYILPQDFLRTFLHQSAPSPDLSSVFRRFQNLATRMDEDLFLLREGTFSLFQCAVHAFCFTSHHFLAGTCHLVPSKGIWNQVLKPEWVWARERGIFQRPPCAPCFPSPPKFGLILQAVSHTSCQLHSVPQRSFSLDRCICVYIPSFSAFISFPK